MNTLLQDVWYGFRTLSKSRGFTAVALLTLALGIGANTAIFSILYALMLRSLPVPHAERLVQLAGIYRNGSKVPLPYGVFRELERDQRVFSEIFAWTGGQQYNVQKDNTLFLAAVRGVSGNYYRAFDAAPYLGRLIEPEDTATIPGNAVAVLGYEYWQRQFGGDPKIVGKIIRIEGDVYTIVGVSRRWFTGMTPGAPLEITVPLTAPPFAAFTTQNSILWLFVTARLNDGATISQAHDQLLSFWRDALAAHPPTNQVGQRLQSFLNMGLDLAPAKTGIHVDLRAHFARPLYVLMGIVALILLVACVNLANLMLARAAARIRDINVRISLGASRVRIVRQLLVETLLLAVCGTLLAVALAYWASRFLVAFMTQGLATTVLLDTRPDWRIYGFATAAALATAFVISLAPAWQLARQQPADLIRSDRRTLATHGRRLARVLIVTQIALSLALLLGAGLLLRTFENLISVDPRFDRTAVLQLVLHPRPASFNNSDAVSYRRELTNQLRARPGVTSAAFGSIEIPARDTRWRDSVSLIANDAAGESGRIATLVVVSPDFFRTLGIPISSGRDFDWNDDTQHPHVAIVDGNLAQRLKSPLEILGARVRFGVQPEFQDMQVVGIARSARLFDLRDASAAVIYVPLTQHLDYGDGQTLFIRAANPAPASQPVENMIQSAGQEFVVRASTLRETTEQALVEDRATAMLATICAGLALLLAGIGLFGLMSYDVTRRTREIGVRMALGSQRVAILRLIMSESLLLTTIGVLAGAPCALAGTRLITHLLVGVTSFDRPTFAVAAITLLVVGAIAGYWPARRATHIDPIVALHDE